MNYLVRVFRIVALLLGVLGVASSAAAQVPQRFALVVGNEAYSGALTRLNRPYEDADRIGNALQSTSFSVTRRRDQGRSDILKEVRNLADRLKAAGPNAVGFFYYSGHGASALVGDQRRNYVIPIGTSISGPDDLVAEGVALDDVIAILNRSQAKAIFIVFDACRSELPWFKGGGDAPDKAFKAVAGGPGMFIAYSTAEGTSAPDDGAFASALASQLVRPGQDHLKAFDAAARSVGKERKGNSKPWYSNQIDDDIYFVGGAPLVSSNSANASNSSNSPGAMLGQAIGNSVVNKFAAQNAFVAAQEGRDVSARAFKDSLADGSEGPILVALPTGSFIMGSPATEPTRESDEGPQRTLKIGRQIAVSKYEVTLAEFRRFVEATGRTMGGNCYADLGRVCRSINFGALIVL